MLNLRSSSSSHRIFKPTAPDSPTKEAEHFSDYPAGRALFGLVHWGGHVKEDNRLYIVGGLIESNDPETGLEYNPVSDIWSLTIETGEWNKISRVVLSDNCGQYFASNSVVTNDGELYIPSESGEGVYRMWLSVPSLSFLCLRVLFERCPQLKQLSDEALVQDVGLPRRVVDYLRPLRGDPNFTGINSAERETLLSLYEYDELEPS